MGEFLDANRRDAGDLILSDDWNTVVAEVDRLDGDMTAVTADTAANSAAIEDLRNELSSALAQITALGSALDSLRGRIRHVTLNTARSHFAVGEEAEIVAQLADVEGNAFAPAPGAEPWVDFVTVWGRFRPVDGYPATGGEDDRTISVRVDSNGIARVRLVADHAGELTEEDSRQVSSILATTVEGRPMSQAILASQTPLESTVGSTFSTMARAYEENDGASFRHYVDHYHLANPAHVIPQYRFGRRWRDHRTVVMAFVKSDDDPLTADLNLGTASIQVTFRDWISPWITYYLDDLDTVVSEARDRLAPRIDVDDYSITSDAWIGEIEGLLADRGVVGRQRYAAGVERAVGSLNVVEPPAYLPQLTDTFRQAMALEKSIDVSRSRPAAGNAAVALGTIGRLDSRARTSTTDAKRELEDFVDAQVSEARAVLNDEVRVTHQQLRDDLFADGGTIRRLEQEVNTVNGIVTSFRNLNVNELESQLNMVQGLNLRVQSLEGRQ